MSDKAEGSASLCARCINFDIQSFASKPTRRKGYRVEDVLKSVDSGCEFCALLLNAITDVETPDYYMMNTLRFGNTVLHPDLYIHMSISDSYKEEAPRDSSTGLCANRLLIELGARFHGVRNISGHEICLAAEPSSTAALSGDIIGRYIGSNPASDSHFETARSWLQDCASHPKCNETVSGSVQIDQYHSLLPTRVIEIARKGKGIYLRNTDGLSGAYITLTHRWNDLTAQCITTTSNYEKRLAGRDFGALPKLFLDAFIIAERLGIRYVWIDSLCIIQEGDAYADWNREAPKMAQYYQFAVFTLAGTTADLSGGLMKPYNKEATPWSSKIVKLPYRDKTATLAGHFYVYDRRVPLVHDYMDQVRSSILFKRGWILQEWLLSKRLIWYTPHGLFYECQQELPRASDQSQLTFGRANTELRGYLELKAAFHHSNNDILGFWYHALDVYSGQHLTRPSSDRMLAVAGLAKEVAPILATSDRIPRFKNAKYNQIYVAGLWLRDLHHGLLWEEQHGVEPFTIRVDEAPSWSWASLMTPVRWPNRGEGVQTMFRLIGFCSARRARHKIADNLLAENSRLQSSNSADEQPYFDPTNMFSCLHINGKLHVVHIRGYLETEKNLKSAAISTAYTHIPKSCNWRALCSAFRPEIIAGWASLERCQSPQTACADYGVAMYALHVSTRYLRHGFWVKSSEPVLDILLVEEVEGSEGVFKRLGVGRIADRALIAEFDETEDRVIQMI